MFFTPELLSKRDSGFGLLWLAATLGSRSAFKKLPKRSVLTADIAQLCDLISEPAEPLALRLSSNLMFGVVRVYKVKQEIFMTDVSNCVVSLKKIIQDTHSSGSSGAQTLMNNPVARPAAVTIAFDPKAAYALDFDALVVDWDAYLNLDDQHDNMNEDDEDFDPKAEGKQQKSARPPKKAPVETVRKEVHTLQENHEHLLSASFDLSFTSHSGQHLEASSSHVDGGFDFLFPLSDGFDLGEGPGIGDDLARELGWGVSPAKSARNRGTNRLSRQEEPIAERMDIVPANNFQDAIPTDFNFDENAIGEGTEQMPPFHAVTSEMMSPCRGDVRRSSVSPIGLLNNTSPHPSLERGMEFLDLGTQEGDSSQPQQAQRKLKRTRVLLDARIELTDDELKIARARYLEYQKEIKREMVLKQREKASGKIVEDLIWSAPKQITNPRLIAFWEDNLRAQINLRIGISQQDRRATKRRKVTPCRDKGTPSANDLPGDINNGMDIDWNFEPQDEMNIRVGDAEQRHSSEEPGRGRRESRASSVVDPNAFASEMGDKANAASSQKSSLFPWDNALPSSSSFNAPYIQPEGNVVPDMVDVRLRSRSISKRGSPLVSSRRNSLNGAGMSPIISRGTYTLDDDFMFNEHRTGTQLDETQLETQQDTQKTDANLITLEKNSFNFLEYAKMQCQTLPQPNGRLTFEKVTPKLTSTRHVAAAAFYHCLVLSTRGLLHLEQREPYGDIFLGIVQ